MIVTFKKDGTITKVSHTGKGIDIPDLPEALKLGLYQMYKVVFTTKKCFALDDPGGKEIDTPCWAVVPRVEVANELVKIINDSATEKLNTTAVETVDARSL